MMIQLRYNRIQRIILLLLLVLPFARIEAQEDSKQNEIMLEVMKLPTRQHYFRKSATQEEVLNELRQGKSDSLLSPSPLLSYYLSKDYQAPKTATLLSSTLNMPLTFQKIKYDDYLNAKELLQIDKSSNNLYRLKEAEPQFYTIAPQLEQWEYDYALYLTTMQALQVQHIDLFESLPLQLDNKNRGLELASISESLPKLSEKEINKGDMHNVVQSLKLQEFEKRHWQTSFESSIQMSQNYISDNWYKGGQSNLNLHTRHYLGLLYRSFDGKIIWNNVLEDKLGIYSAEDTKNKAGYKISDDLLRLRTNFGLKAKGNWYYSFDAELRTQLFDTYKNEENKEVLQSAFFAPFNLNTGLGMKYSYSKRGKVYGSKFSFSTNIAPLSFTYKKSFRDDIDLARYGFSKEKLSTYSLGSTLRARIDWQFNMDVSWTSRFYFNTSYSHIETEWENTLNMKIGRYFSTRINLHLRYDDSVPPLNNWQRYLQVNELLSFGFNYKL